MAKSKAFSCGTCGGRVTFKKGPGRTYEYRRGVRLPVPSTFEIPTCNDCGERYFSSERSEALDALLKPVFAEWQTAHCNEVVERIQARHGTTLRELERACGVTPTYLSHILSGRKAPSDMLVFLLEAYALTPAEFVRRKDGVPWADALPKQPTKTTARADRMRSAR